MTFLIFILYTLKHSRPSSDNDENLEAVWLCLDKAGWTIYQLEHKIYYYMHIVIYRIYEVNFSCSV